jgi:hypothetical protein
VREDEDVFVEQDLALKTVGGGATGAAVHEKRAEGEVDLKKCGSTEGFASECWSSELKCSGMNE